MVASERGLLAVDGLRNWKARAVLRVPTSLPLSWGSPSGGGYQMICYVGWG